MAVNVRISQKGLFKKKLTVENIAELRNLSYGISDANCCLIENEIGKYTLVYDSKNLARGIEVSFEDTDVLLRLNLPTSRTEIHLFYDLIQEICKKFNTDKFTREGEETNVDLIPTFIQYDDEASCNALVDVKNKLIENNYEQLTIFGVLNPIAIGIESFEEINGDTDKLGIFLNRLQQMDVYYANPKVYQKNEKMFGIYFIGEEITSVVPVKPYILFNQIEGINDWYVMIPENHMIRYEDFINHIVKLCDYDATHIVVNLTKEDIEKLVLNYKTEL